LIKLNIEDTLLVEIMQELMVNCYFNGHFKTGVLERAKQAQGISHHRPWERFDMDKKWKDRF